MTYTIINSSGFIKALNIRKVGPEDEKILALDIKVSGCSVSIEFLTRILGADDWADVRLAFWDAGEAFRFLGMDTITTTGIIQNCSLTLGGLKLHGVELRKFRATIRDACRVELEFSAAISSPPANAAPILAEMLGEEVDVTVSEAQAGLDLGPPLSNSEQLMERVAESLRESRTTEAAA